MFSRTFRVLTATAALAIVLPACTTVNMTGLGAAQASESRPLSKVEQSAKALNVAFAKAGWTERVKGSTPMTTLSILLKGLPASTSEAATHRYNVGHTAEETVSDMTSAAQYVEQTANIAQAHLNSASSQSDLSYDLVELERALSAARSAKAMFAVVDTRDIRPELTDLTAAVADLFDVTNAYGDRVRSDYMTPSTTASRS